MNTKRAFTLIELLVVIAIIAILAAILFPVFAQAKAAAKKTADLSNQKNIAMGGMMYLADNDDFYPRHVYNAPGRMSGGWSVPLTWREATMPYIKNGETNYIVTGGNVRLAQGGIWDTPARVNARGSYTINRLLSPGKCYWWGEPRNSWLCDSDDFGVRNSEPVLPSVTQTELDAPAQIIMNFTVGINPEWNAAGDYSEASWWWWGGATWPPVFSGPNSGEQWDADSNVFPTYSMPRYRYTGGMNTTFADGHAKWVKKGAANWCRMVYVKGKSVDYGQNDDWMFDPGQPCAAFAR